MRWPWSRDKKQEETERHSEETRVNMDELAQRLEHVAENYLSMLRKKAANGHG
jgi:hypothetical protein